MVRVGSAEVRADAPIADVVAPSVRYVLAAVDTTEIAHKVRLVASRMADRLRVPLRTVTIRGPMPKGLGYDACFTQIDSGEADEVPGNLVRMLAGLVNCEAHPLVVMGRHPRPPDGRVGRRLGTCLRVASISRRPLLVVPPSLGSWEGPHRVLVPLDGSSIAALGASSALQALSLDEPKPTTVHVFDERSAPRFWDDLHHEYQAWSREFRARYLDDVIGDHLEIRAGPRSTSAQLVEMAASGAFDLVALVWSQRTGDGRAQVLREVLYASPVPVLLIPASYGVSAVAHIDESGPDGRP